MALAEVKNRLPEFVERVEREHDRVVITKHGRPAVVMIGDDASVIRGIASTARVITSAALIMISVFLGFVLGDDPVIKMMGLGLATAIFVDATIVRLVLVPATMKLMGDANWWIPAWLDRLIPTIDIEGEAGLPEPELEGSWVEDDRDDRREPDTEPEFVPELAPEGLLV